MVNLNALGWLTDSLSRLRSLSTFGAQEVDGALRRALPGRCAFCLSAKSRERPWCPACHESLPWNLPACPRCAEPQPGQLLGRPCGACLRLSPHFDRARVPLRYEAEVNALVQRFKFHASPRAGAILLALLEEALPARAQVFPEALMAVPLHPARARERGFDQADWLTHRLARRLGVPRIIAHRLRDTRTQRGLDREERRANLRAAFAVPSRLPRRLALLDDVMTTGATLDALAQACQRSGAEEIEVWAVARTPLQAA